MRALRRTLEVLEVLANSTDGVSLTDVCRASGLDASTALRYLNALIALGYATADPGSKPKYYMGVRLIRLGGASKIALLQQIARPYMEALRDACNEDVTLATLESGSILCLETERSSHVLRANIPDGTRAAAHASSLGKSILAYMPWDRARALLMRAGLKAQTPNTLTSLGALKAELARVRERGYATDREEYAPGVVCVGAPIFDAPGHVVAALSITVPTLRLPLPELESKHSAALIDTCRRISRDLGFSSAAASAAASSGQTG